MSLNLVILKRKTKILVSFHSKKRGRRLKTHLVLHYREVSIYQGEILYLERSIVKMAIPQHNLLTRDYLSKNKKEKSKRLSLEIKLKHLKAIIK